MLLRILGILSIVAITLLPMAGCAGGGAAPSDGADEEVGSYDEESSNTTNN